MGEDFWPLILTQVPAVVGFFTALQRGWLYIGSTFDRERSDWQDRLAASERREAIANDERQEAQVRLDSFRETMRDNVAILERSVALTEAALKAGK